MSAIRFKVDRRSMASAAVKAAAADALGDGAEFLLEEANRTVPIEEGTLTRSGTTSLDAGALKAAVAYDTAYAARQHEDMTLRHDAGRRAKWLEQTFKEQAPNVGDFIASKIRGAIR